MRPHVPGAAGGSWGLPRCSVILDRRSPATTILPTYLFALKDEASNGGHSVGRRRAGGAACRREHLVGHQLGIQHSVVRAGAATEHHRRGRRCLAPPPPLPPPCAAAS